MIEKVQRSNLIYLSHRAGYPQFILAAMMFLPCLDRLLAAPEPRRPPQHRRASLLLACHAERPRAPIPVCSQARTSSRAYTHRSPILFPDHHHRRPDTSQDTSV